MFFSYKPITTGFYMRMTIIIKGLTEIRCVSQKLKEAVTDKTISYYKKLKTQIDNLSYNLVKF